MQRMSWGKNLQFRFKKKKSAVPIRGVKRSQLQHVSVNGLERARETSLASGIVAPVMPTQGRRPREKKKKMLFFRFVACLFIFLICSFLHLAYSCVHGAFVN